MALVQSQEADSQAEAPGKSATSCSNIIYFVGPMTVPGKPALLGRLLKDLPNNFVLAKCHVAGMELGRDYAKILHVVVCVIRRDRAG